MNKKINLLSILLITLPLVSCGETSNTSSSNSSEVSSSIVSEAPSSQEAVESLYKATVLFPDGTPAVGAKVQWCTETLCKSPVLTNENGVATADYDDDTYHVHITEASVPQGYTYDPNIYTATASAKEVTINLIKLSESTQGTGSFADPIQISAGYYLSASFASASDIVYYEFKATEVGTYTFESIATNVLPTKPANPYIGYFGTKDEGREDPYDEDDNTAGGVNFKFTLEVSDTSVSYIFCLMSIYDKSVVKTSYPSTYYFGVTKN